MNAITNTWNQLSRLEREEALNKVDNEITELLINAKKECRYLCTGAISFSPKLSRARLTYRF